MATEHHEQNEELDQKLHVRAALRPVVEAVLPEGRRGLSPRWFRQVPLPPGTTVLARRLAQERRARLRRQGRLKNHPDVLEQNSRRSLIRWTWQFDQDNLFRWYGCSNALH